MYLLTFSGSLTLTYNASSLILPGKVSIVTQANDSATAIYLGSGNWQVVQYQRLASQPYNGASPTVQRWTSGTSQTYTPTSGMVRIHVRMAGGGAGGTGQGNNGLGTAGSPGGATSFGGWGAAGGTQTAGGTGGANGTGTLVMRLAGGAGQGPGAVAVNAQLPGGQGGVNLLGGAGAGGYANEPGQSGVAGTGAGGGGEGGTNSVGNGEGGSAGEYVEFYMLAAQVGASAPYTVGAGGASVASGAGGSGSITVEELYN